MDEKPVTADVVVACLVAGVGAWAGIYEVLDDAAPTYAAELFGDGSEDMKADWPMDDAGNSLGPVVRVTLPDLDTGVGTLTFKLGGGAVFAESVSSVDFTNAPAAGTDPTPLNEISVEQGGNVGDDFVTIRRDLGDAEVTSFGTDSSIVRLGTADTDGDGDIDADDTTADTDAQSFLFVVPPLKSLTTLRDPTRAITIGVSAEAVTGVFPDGKLKAEGLTIATLDMASSVLLRSASAVSLTSGRRMDDKGESSVRIDIDDRTMLRANSFTPPFTNGAPVAAYQPRTWAIEGGDFAAQLAYLDLVVRSEVTECGAGGMAPNCGDTIHQWDGTRVDSHLAGVLDIDVTGAIREDDMVFANRDDDDRWWSPYISGADPRSIDSGESLTVKEGMAEFTTGGYSIDPGVADEKTTEVSTKIGVYYIPNGKDDVAHGATIHLTAMVNFTRASARDESLAPPTTTELRFHGVNQSVKAYAIPFDGNGKGDKANVRIRCEGGDWFTGECRPFLECWDDMGMRSFGEAEMIAVNALDTLNSMQIEAVVDVSMASSRHSCRVLSTGTTTVQQLTRDGSSGTLVNNTYVGE